jgi:hypothetical protein
VSKKNDNRVDLSMLPLTSRVKVAMVVAAEAMEEGDFIEVSRWLRLGARVADEIDDIIYDVERTKNEQEEKDGDVL